MCLWSSIRSIEHLEHTHANIQTHTHTHTHAHTHAHILSLTHIHAHARRTLAKHKGWGNRASGANI